MIQDGNPFVPSHFWNICQTLLGFFCQLQYSCLDGDVPSLYLSLDLEDQSVNMRCADIVKHFEPYFVDHVQDEYEDENVQQMNGKNDRPEANGHQVGR